MSRRSSSTAGFGANMFENISTNIDSVVLVAENMDTIKEIMDIEGFEELLEEVRETLDFTNIVVVSGEEANWDSATKTLTVPTLKGDTGDDGEDGKDLTVSNITENGDGTFTWIFSDGTVFTTSDLRGPRGYTGDDGRKGDKGDPLHLVSITDNGDYTFTWSFDDGSVYTTPSLRGHTGDKGDTGDSVSIDDVEYLGNGEFLWKFSDGTDFTTPDLRGPKGEDGERGKQGIRGETGMSVHHLRLTTTTDPDGIFGSFGELDTYTFYGDAHEEAMLGYFSVRNGVSDVDDLTALGVMLRRTYDTDDSGVVDDSEKLQGKALSDLGLFFTVSEFSTITEPDSDIPEGSIVLVRNDGTGRWALVSVDEKLPALVTTTLITQEIIGFVGTAPELTTTAKRLTTAISELDGEIGEVDTLTTDGKQLVPAINELHSNLGKVADLATDSKVVVTAINEVLEDVGSVDSLTTTDKTVVGAINEHDAEIGDTDILTVDADTLVGGINELHLDVGDVPSLTTTADNLTGAVNELDAEVGPVETLTTVNKTVVTSINELDSEVGDLSTLVTEDKTSLVVAVNELHEDAIIESARVDKQHQDYIDLTEDGTGFVDRSSTHLVFDKTTRTIVIGPVGASFDVYESGKKFTYTDPISIVVPDTNVGGYITLDTSSGSLVLGGAYPGFSSLLVAYYVWSVTDQDFVVEGDERHSAARDTTWHTAQHLNEGMVWRSGGNAVFTLDDASDVSFKLTAPVVVADEDLVHVIAQGTGTEDFHQDIEGGVYPIMAVSGDHYTQSVPSTAMYISGGNGIMYNKIDAGVGSLEDVPDGKYVNYFVMASHCQKNPIKVVAGRNVYDSPSEAGNESLLGYGINWPEFVYLYNLVFKKDSTITENPGKVVLDTVLQPARPLTGLSSVGVESHELLFDRDKPDQHPIGSVTGLQAALNLKADKAVDIQAGTGLMGGGALTESRTLSVDFGNVAGKVTEGNDPRLSDAREWEADTITELDAKEGTSTDRKAFTAERVRQSTEAWWDGTASTTGKSVVAGTAEEARTALGLGEASVADVGTTAGTVAAGDDSRFTDMASRIGELENETDVVRGKLAAAWATENPLLADGEMGREKDTDKFKFGDGVTPWNSLDYAVADVELLQTTGNSETKGMSQKAITVAISEASGGGGGENPLLATPSITYPAEGAVDVAIRPTVTGSAFDPLDGADTLDGVFFRFKKDGVAVHTSPKLATTSYTPGIGDLEGGVEYELRVLYVGTLSGQSAWSDPVWFTTIPITIEKPTILSPLEGAVDIPEQPVLEISEFNDLADTAVFDSAVFVIKNSLGVVVHTSPEQSSYLYAVPAGVLLEGENVYTVEGYLNSVEHGVSPTSDPVSFTTLLEYSSPYGLTWDSSQPTGGYTRTGDAYFTAIQSQMRRCLLLPNGTVNYFLDPTDSTKKENGTPSVLTGADGEVMVQIPKFYVKRSTSGTMKTVEVSEKLEPGFSLHPAFLKAGVEVDYRYYGAYQASQSGTKLESRSGTTPKGSITIAQARTAAEAVGAGWHQLDWYLLDAVKILCSIEIGTFDSQSVLGTGGSSATSGDSNSIGNGSSNSGTTDWMSYRGIENFYGNKYKFVDGINVREKVPYINGNYTSFASDVFTGGYVSSGVTLPTNGYIRDMAFSGYGFIPNNSTGGSDSTYVPDFVYSNTGDRIAFHGSSGGASYAGAFSLRAGDAASYAGASLGAALVF